MTGRVVTKVVKALLWGSALVLAILLVSHFAWKYSGSNKWELVIDNGRVQVYALKTPGFTLKKFKAITRVKTTLNRVVAAMMDTSSEACQEFAPGCTSGKVLEPWNSQTRYFVQSYRVVLPAPFAPRDLIIKSQLSQDPQSKALLVMCTALPEMLPPNPCCVRVKDIHNSWRYTPLENGEIEIEFVGDYDPAIPYFMFNQVVPGALEGLLGHIESFFNQKKYQRADFAFLREP